MKPYTSEPALTNPHWPLINMDEKAIIGGYLVQIAACLLFCYGSPVLVAEVYLYCIFPLFSIKIDWTLNKSHYFNVMRSQHAKSSINTRAEIENPNFVMSLSQSR